MENVTKVYFDPIIATKEKIRSLLRTLPVGSAHPFRADGVLLHHSAPDTITDIDISMHPEEYFSNAINLAELGEGTLERMKLFPQLSKFNEEYMIQQAPSPTFEVPLVNDSITIFAVSKRAPTYYDLCIADSGHKTSCYSATTTFPGLIHSGDNNNGSFLLQHIKVNTATLQETEYVIFVSGYSHNLLTKYKAENPLVLVAHHRDKVLYVVPVPLDEASIGKAILCCPMVIKANKADGSLICSILPTPTTDDNLMCSGPTLASRSFGEAVGRADFTLTPASFGVVSPEVVMSEAEPMLDSTSSSVTDTKLPPSKRNVILATMKVTLPEVGQMADTQLIRFGNGIEWMAESHVAPLEIKSSSVLPCILGGILEGPLLLATGDAPKHLPFDNDAQLRRYYRQAKTVTVLVDQEMTDNARNLATMWRINALFIVQVKDNTFAENPTVLPVLEGLNINAVTALAGPQSLVLAQIGKRYYFYRGIANRDHFDTVNMEFGQDVTQLLGTVDMVALIDARWPRLVNLSEDNKIFLPKSGLELPPKELQSIFEGMSLTEVESLKEDIIAAIPQLQALMIQKDLEELSSALLAIVQSKITKATAEKKRAYVKFLTQEYAEGDAESKRTKERLLADLRRATKEAQSSVVWLTKSLGNMISSQNTSTKTHDLKRLLRQSAIRSNVDAVKKMTFETLAGLLETHAEEMGVLVVNIDTDSYRQLLRNPESAVVRAKSCLDLEPRVLHLEGLDAGIVLEQSQNVHTGPLVSQLGPSQPILAMPYMSAQSGIGSMLVWVCWDEFVNLENPSSVRWVEKCNESHIAALRIIMRDTISSAVSSRECNMASGSEETGQLMSFLLMASMDKLAKMRTTAPTPTIQAPDTITKLMRGLFGHLLTVAGSGLQPMSMVWQLMGSNPLLEVPKTTTAWKWYENVAMLYPYTGWPTTILNKNLEKLLDKVIFRLIIHNKLSDGTNQLRAQKMEEACKFRNVQLSHSRMAVIALMKILSAETGYQKMALNLLHVLPKPVENKKASYSRLYFYVEHLANGGEKKHFANIVAANVYTRRSTTFCELKRELTEAMNSEDKAQIDIVCQKIIDKRKGIALTFRVETEEVKVQCIKNIQNLLNGPSTFEPVPPQNMKDMYKRVKCDDEQRRQPWQIGNGKYGTIEPLDVDALMKVLNAAEPQETANLFTISSTDVTMMEPAVRDWAQFEKLSQPAFLKKVQQATSAKEVCDMLKVPESMMQVFASLLAPGFQFERLPDTFKDVVYTLLQNPNQETAKPTKQLFGHLTVEAVQAA